MKTSLLVKFCISDYSPEYLVGALLEDYINLSNKNSYSTEIIEGYTHQRMISSIFANHPAYQRSEQLLDCKLRKSSDKIIPIFYDHFLRVNWSMFSENSFEDFHSKLTLNFSENKHYLPFKYAKLLTVLEKKTWYNELQTIGGMHGIMKQQTKYFTFNVNLEHSINSLIENYSEHKANFFEIFSDLKDSSHKYTHSRKVAIIV